MRKRLGKGTVGLLVALVAGAFATTAAAGPIFLIGPGADYPGTGELDSAGARLNVERDAVHLNAGTYFVLNFSMDTGNADGYVTPFLATGTPSTYQVLWVGNQFDPSASGIQTDTYVYGAEQFYLPAAADVYVGFYQSSNLVYLISNVGRTDHNNTPTEPTFVGETVSGFSHANWPRTYGFEVNVELTPEPTTLTLLGLGCLALLRRRRRRV